MNVLVTLARQPFARTAAAILAETLVARLCEADGVRAESMTLPVGPGEGERLLDAAAQCGMLRTVNADRMIALNFPAYLMPYESKVVWLAAAEDLPAPACGERAQHGRPAEIARILAHADGNALLRAERLFCGSAGLAAQIRRWCGARAEVMPVPDADDRAGWAAAVTRLVA